MGIGVHGKQHLLQLQPGGYQGIHRLDVWQLCLVQCVLCMLFEKTVHAVDVSERLDTQAAPGAAVG